jgi:glycerol-3-phosphate acyltransferase PlsY
MRQIIIAIIISYFVGSIPTAYVLGRLLKGIDIRKSGSGNVGATNAFRVLGKSAGITVLLIDIVKGLFCVVVVGSFAVSGNVAISDLLVRVILGIVCICGHNWTVFLRFKGGKGVATTLGVLIGLGIIIPGLGLALALAVLAWAAVFAVSRIVSVASIISSILFPIFVFLLRQPPAILILSIVLSGFILIRHKSNIQRIIQGKERRLI